MLDSRARNREETKDEKLGKAVKRIWEERGGILSLTEHDLLTSSSSSSSGHPVALDDDDGLRAQAGSSEGAYVGIKEEVGQAEGLDLEGMRAFKTEVWGQLEYVPPPSLALLTITFIPLMPLSRYDLIDPCAHAHLLFCRQAKHSLSNFHHVLTLLLPSSLTTGDNPQPVYQLPGHIPLPPSSLSTTLLTRAPFTPTSEGQAQLLARKQADLRSTAALLAQEAERLKKVVEKNKQEWDVAESVKRGGWAVALRSLKSQIAAGGGGGGELGGKRDERDWESWYALVNSTFPLSSPLSLPPLRTLFFVVVVELLTCPGSRSGSNQPP